MSNTPYLSSLSRFACIAFSGDDATEFLQGQFTNDLASQMPGEQRLNGYCNPKGRLLAVFRMLRAEDRWLMVIPEDLVEAIAKRLTLYRMRSKVTIERLESIHVLGIGNQSPRDIDGMNPSDCWQVSDTRWITVADELPEQSSGFDAEGDRWCLDEIMDGIPTVVAATSEQFIPQHINLDLAGGVSFTKGCYPGQEIVARLRYLGKLKQRMIGGTTDASSVEPGTPVFSPDRGESKAGLVVDTVTVGDRSHLLVNVPAVAIESGELRIGAVDGPLLERVALPYAITTEMRGG